MRKSRNSSEDSTVMKLNNRLEAEFDVHGMQKTSDMQDAVLSDHIGELKALRTSDLKFSKVIKDDLDDETPPPVLR